MTSSQRNDPVVYIGYCSDGIVRIKSDGQMTNSIFRNMYENKIMCDVSLRGVPPVGVEPGSLHPIRGHKVVLAAASSHLLDLFTAVNYTDSCQPEYNIEIVDHETLYRIVDFIYTDQLSLNAENAVEVVRKILIGADYLVMKGLPVGCENYLAERINSGNCISLWCFARKYSCLTLMHATSTYIVTHLTELPNNDEFLRMPYDDLAKLLLSEAFIGGNGEERYCAATAWLGVDADNRAVYVYDVMNMIPLASGELSTGTIFEANENEMLREHALELLRQATMNSLKVQVEQVAEYERKKIVAVEGLDPTQPNFPIHVEVSNGPTFTIQCASSTTIPQLKKYPKSQRYTN